MDPERTTVVFVESYPHVLAGQQRTLLSLIEAAADCGLQPTVLVPGEGVYLEELQRRSVCVEVVPYTDQISRYGGAIYRDRWQDRFGTLAAWLRYTKTCRSKLKSLQPAAVFCNDMRGLLTVGLAARTLRIPVMIWDKLDKPHGVLDWLQLPIASSNAIISKSVLKKYPRIQQWWYRDKIRLLPNGADLERFASGKSLREELQISPACPIIGIVGTVTPRKGHDRLLRLVPQLEQALDQFKILVVGSWNDSKEDAEFYESLPHRDHPSVLFLGPRSDIVDLMHTIDLLTVPSRHEGMGQVTVEAMAAGKPVIGANVGGIPEVVKDGETGLIFDRDDDYLDCLVRLAVSPKLRQRMGQAGRLRCRQEYNRPEQMKKVCQLLREMI